MDTREQPPFVFITSRAHVPRMHAHKILIANRYIRWLMVVDDKEQVARAINEAGVPEAHVIASYRPKNIPPMDGIAWTRQFIEHGLVKTGDWYVSLDDNVYGWTWLPDPWYWMTSVNHEIAPEGLDISAWRRLYETMCPFDQVVAIWREMIMECELLGTWAGGFSVENNHFFRSKKWQHHGYVRAQNAVWKNMGQPFYYWEGNMFEDFTRSVDVVVRTGRVLINRFLKPIKMAFEEGGIGPFDQRRPALTAVCDRLMQIYPGLLRRVKDREYSLMFALHTQKSVDEWRRKNGWL